MMKPVVTVLKLNEFIFKKSVVHVLFNKLYIVYYQIYCLICEYEFNMEGGKEISIYVQMKNFSVS